ncbi:MAG TPA: hypothetical protein VNU19_10220 [Candidatus Acidoferrum sp.]|jgi:hypothetical protein|nr:hypothetical protein [Candidatus Acidoferrum sp.]
MNQLHDDLRQLFEREIGAPPPGARQRVLAGVSHATPRPTKRWQTAASVVALLLAAAIVVTLLVARENQRTVPGNKPTGVIPWLPLLPQLYAPVVPSPTPSPLPTGTQPCTPAQLQVEVLGNNGAGGHVFRGFGFSGRGPAACFVEGTPAVTLYDRSGRRLPFKPRSFFGGSDSTAPVLIKPGPLPDPYTNLTYGQAALTIDWVTQPEACPGSSSVQVALAKITLPSGGPSLTVTLPSEQGAYTCQGLGIDVFVGPPPTIEQPPPLPLPSIALKAPRTTRAGSQLVYQVTLTNETLQPIDLVTNCPDYGEELFPSDPSGIPPIALKPLFELNCTPAGTIQPASSLTFEMRLAVPGDDAPGTYALVFTLGYWNAMTKPMSAQITISG